MRTNPNAMIADRLEDAADWRRLAGMSSSRFRLDCIRKSLQAVDAARYIREQRQSEARSYDADRFGLDYVEDARWRIMQPPRKLAPFERAAADGLIKMVRRRSIFEQLNSLKPEA